MGFIELFFIALGLSMDAFAVSVTNGMCAKNVKLGWTFMIALTFGLFQGAMPAIGYFLGQTFTAYVTHFDHVIALVLLGIIGGKMLFEAIKEKDCDACDSVGMKLTLNALLVQGLATSIDALAVGVSFSAMRANIVASAAFIALVTFVCCFAGVFIGKRFGAVLTRKAEIAGGIILIGIGLKIFIEHTFFGG